MLDTHVALWAVTAPERLSATMADLIADPDNDVAVSIASLWELAIKRPLQRGTDWDIGMPAERAAAEFRAASLDILAIEVRHLSALEALPPHHGDPFDRLLVAIAHADTYRLVTHDKRLAAYGDHVLLV
ncbi:MAG: type II toxin-antitoxin system VapC family toxin [Sphingomonas sp.]